MSDKIIMCIFVEGLMGNEFFVDISGCALEDENFVNFNQGVCWGV